MPTLRPRLAEGFRRAAVASLILVPVGMVIAHRSSPLFVVSSALLSLIAAGLEGRIRSVLQAVLASLASPLGWAVAAFFGWCLISIGWSEFKLVSLRALGEFWLSVAATFILALTLAEHLTRKMFWGLAVAFVLAGLIILIELKTGLRLRKALGVSSRAYIFNRSVLTLLVFLLPLSAWFLDGGRKGMAYGLALLLFLCAVAIRSESDAAVLGLAMVCIVFPLAWLAPRLTAGLTALAFLAAFCISPFIGPITSRLITPEMHKMIASGHSQQRVALWNSFDSALWEQPVLGGGFGISPRMAQTSVAAKVPVEQQAKLNIGHPHNAALQIWVELGVVGAFLSLAVAFFTLFAISWQPHLIRCAFLAMVAGAAPAALVGHGAWQGWWAASIGAAVIWMQAARRLQTEIQS